MVGACCRRLVGHGTGFGCNRSFTSSVLAQQHRNSGTPKAHCHISPQRITTFLFEITQIKACKKALKLLENLSLKEADFFLFTNTTLERSPKRQKSYNKAWMDERCCLTPSMAWVRWRRGFLRLTAAAPPKSLLLLRTRSPQRRFASLKLVLHIYK